MTFFLLAYLGGMLTIASPCILPVLPFVFARSSTEPFYKGGLPLLLGMAVTFAIVASLVAIGGSIAIKANEYGRLAALVLLALIGVSLLWKELANRLMQPFARLGERLSLASGTKGTTTSSFFLGIATGLLWTPCAGPILGLLLTAVALQGANIYTSLLLLAYAAGAASVLGLALFAGERVFKALKRFLGVDVWIRRLLGVAVLAGVATIAMGVDRGVLTAFSLVNTTRLEQSLLDRFPAWGGLQTKTDDTLIAQENNQISPDESASNARTLPDFSGATTWLNTLPLNAAALKGKVVLVDFWTYSCINCLRSLPYVRAWHEKYKDQGLVVVGVHTPEFAFEKIPENVRKAVHDLGITYPVALDNNYAIWKNMNNQYWPAHYFFDSHGRLRHSHFGEGEYVQSEQVIQKLLAERNGKTLASNFVAVQARGAQAASTTSDVISPETYIGYGFHQAGHFVAMGGYAQERDKNYQAPKQLGLNDWSLIGNWRAQAESATLLERGGRIVFRFQARDLHLVLGPSNRLPIRFRITLDGVAPAYNHGVDVDAQGMGIIKEQRLYQLIRQRDAQPQAHTFEIEFLDPGVEAFSFTFG